MNPSDEFYIGWEAKSPPRLAKTARRTVLVLLALAALLSITLAAAQRLIGRSAFEWRNVKTFSGVLRTTPYPHLLVSRPAGTNESSAYSTYHLVAPWKFGLKPDTIAALDSKPVTLQGTLIYRDNQTMIEALPDSIKASETSPATGLPRAIPLGQQTLIGEIVDSKCFLGVMNPGSLAPHRACAIRCINGGIPPMLLVRQKKGPPTYLLLVSADGQPVNQQVLDLVSEPIRITGKIERQGESLILKADPITYQRVR